MKRKIISLLLSLVMTLGIFTPYQSFAVGYIGVEHIIDTPVYQLTEDKANDYYPDSDEANKNQDNNDLNDIGLIYFKDINSWDDVDYYQDICFVHNQLLLTAYDNVSFNKISELADSLNASIVGFIELTNDYQIEFNEDVTADYLNTIINDLASNPLIEYAAFNVATGTEDDVDSLAWSSWKKTNNNRHLNKANVIEAWNSYPKTRNVKVKMGLIENNLSKNNNNTNLEFTHIWYENEVIPNYDTSKSMMETSSNKKSHGIHVAGIMAGFFNETDNTSGVCPNNKLYGFTFKGKTTSLSTIMKYKVALALMIGNNVRVINVSMGRDSETSENTIINGAETLNQFINKLLDMKYDFIIISAAGNVQKDAKYNNFLNYIGKDMGSSASERIIVVGRMNNNGKYHTDSCYGFDILAPGELIYSTVAGGYTKESGTSMAAPIVAGIAGMIYAEKPELRGNHVKQAILSSEAKSKDGYKKVDAKAAIKKAIELSDELSNELSNDKYSQIDDKITLMGTVSVTLGIKQLTQTELLGKTINFYSVNTENECGALIDSAKIVKDDDSKYGQYDIVLDKEKLIKNNTTQIIIGIDLGIIDEKPMQYFTNPISLSGSKVFIRNLILNVNTTKDSKTSQSLGDVTVSLEIINSAETENSEGNEDIENIDEVYTSRVVTDDLGRFVLNLPDGYYNAEFTKDGYYPKTITIKIIDGIIYDINGNALEEIELSSIVTLKGTVKDEATLQSIANVSINIYDSKNQLIRTEITNSKGEYEFNLTYGTYTLKFNKDGYDEFEKLIDINTNMIYQNDIIMIADDIFKIPDSWNLPDPASNEVVWLINVPADYTLFIYWDDDNMHVPTYEGGNAIWDWGDGIINITSESYVPLAYQHTYTEAGIYTCRFTTESTPAGNYGAGVYMGYGAMSEDNVLISAIYGEDVGFYGVFSPIARDSLQYIRFKGEAKTPSATTSGWLRDCKVLQRVDFDVLPHTIYPGMFMRCDSLKNINFTKNAVTIGELAFDSCVNLKSVNLSSCEYIDGYAFSNCSSLIQITAPILKTAGKNFMTNCYSLRSINAPLLESIGNPEDCVLQSCLSLQKIYTPMLKYVSNSGGNGSFCNAYALSEFIYADGCNFNGATFVDCFKLDPKPY